MLHAVIMAGGSGTRFWPESRADRPKQLLRLVGDKTMLRATVDRLAGLVPPERLLVATTARLAGAVSEEIAELPADRVLCEPLRRNTAPCIGLAAVALRRSDPQATMAVMPADHLIQPAEQFCRALQLAEALVEEDPRRLLTFGIRPTYPAEIFGYIERGEALNTQVLEKTAAESGAPAVYQVRCFREKPDAQTAREYLAAGRFYWNAGIFVWKAETILDCLRRYEPAIHQGLERIAAAFDTPEFEQVLREQFEGMPDISIDYAVMEKADHVAVIVSRVAGTDEHGNTVIGRHLGIETSGSIVRTSDDHLVVTLGLRDCIVVHTPDATLVADKHQEEAVRRVVKLLEHRGWKEFT